MKDIQTHDHYPLEITDFESAQGFQHLTMVVSPDSSPDKFRLVGLVLDSFEVIVKVKYGYQVLRYGWHWVGNVTPKLNKTSHAKWILAGNTVLTVELARKLANDLPIINGPVEVTDGAEIIQNQKS